MIDVFLRGLILLPRHGVTVQVVALMMANS